MKIRDPLPDWSEPKAVKLWGDEISPRPRNAWLDYINYNVHPDVVTVVGRLLFPVFVEHEGGIFLRDTFSAAGFSTWKTKLGNIETVEKLLNHQHVYDLFGTDEEVMETSFDAVANLMAYTLRLALRDSFPQRRFSVYASRTDQEYGPVVGFHSIDLPGSSE